MAVLENLSDHQLWQKSRNASIPILTKSNSWLGIVGIEIGIDWNWNWNWSELVGIGIGGNWLELEMELVGIGPKLT